MLKVSDIKRIIRDDEGYKIVFDDNKYICINKRRTIIALLLLIEYQVCSEADLAGANDRLKCIKKQLEGKIDPSWIQDRYGDANKPFSELWTEEGFTCVRAEGLKGNRQYVLDVEQHELLFNVHKICRQQLTNQEKLKVLEQQNYRCNICGAKFKIEKTNYHVFAKDRTKLEFDHRIPIEKNGKSTIENYQALCHYCNKSKRQICFICSQKNCNYNCALVYPEKSQVISATNENISDRMRE